MTTLIATRWQDSLANAIRDPETLINRLELSGELIEPARRAAKLFSLMVTESFLARMQHGNPGDPLLRQVLPLDLEFEHVAGFTTDALGEDQAHRAPGMLQKYAGRVLLILTGACAVNCRYCFRRHYPYGNEPRRLDDWEPVIHEIAQDTSIREVILSGGDPLMLSGQRFDKLLSLIEPIKHVARLRIHSRLPIVLPDRIDDEFLERLRTSRLTTIMVVHANHAREIAADCRESLVRLVAAGIPTLNQSVLLRDVNDTVDLQADLCTRLADLGVMPYYLHLLDRVSGTAHFEVAESVGRSIVEELRKRLPGYAVPRLVREIPGEPHKTVLS